jgi:DNA primase
MMHSFGFNTTVASLGTALTEKHAEQLKRVCENLIILYDGDSAGQKATMRAIEILKPFGFNLKIGRLPNGLDPDDYLKQNGAEKMKTVLDKAKTPIEYQLDLLLESHDLNRTEDKADYVKKSLALISSIETMSEKEVYLKIISKFSGIPFDILRRDSNSVNIKDATKEEKEVLIKIENGNIKAIKYILASIIRGESFTQIDFDLKPYFTNPLFKNILLGYQELVKSKKKVIGLEEELLDGLDWEEKELASELISSKYEPNKDYFNQCVWKVVEDSLKVKQQILNEEYKSSEDKDERLRIAKEIAEIAKKLKTKKIN